ncbi:Peroxidase 1 [Hordeum vulgare]|nr:Peroxidase 1 [Hordeum vulgare]
MLLDSTDGSPTEKDAMPNQSPRGMDVVARVKDKPEKVCPATVSCADLLALMSRDAVVLVLHHNYSSKGLSWLVVLGRRDGRTSRAGNCGRLPLLYGNITVMIKVFAAKGLDVKDLVMLSAAHTFGKEHCSSFADLLELYNGSICSTDTTLDERYTDRLRMRCCGPRDISTTAELDAYRQVARRHGLLMSDAGLMDHPFRF